LSAPQPMEAAELVSTPNTLQALQLAVVVELVVVEVVVEVVEVVGLGMAAAEVLVEMRKAMAQSPRTKQL